jgi:hypothetical protein
VFPRDMVCLRNISVDTLHKGDTEDNNNNNNNNNNVIWNGERFRLGVWVGSITEQMRRQQNSLTFHATAFGLKQRK